MRSQDRLGQRVPAAAVAGAPWRPLLSGPLRDRAMETVHRLAADLDRWDVSASQDASLASGSAGIAVCHAAMARAGHDDRAGDLACARLDEAVDLLSRAPMVASLYSGFTGIAWASELVDRLLGEADDDRNDGIDQALAGWLSRSQGDDGPYDLIHGLTGLGVYALARWPRAGAVQVLSGVLDQLARRARHDDDGIYWWTPPTLLFGPRRELHPDGEVDLGVAHGVAAVIPLLARARTVGLAPGTVDALLDSAVRWLSAHLLDTPSGPALPSFVAPASPPEPARTAWCYGSPGVSAAVLLAALDTGERDWYDLAVRLGLEAAARPPDRTGVVDAGLCHGSAGVGHLFNRLHQLTGIPEFEDAARFWLLRTLDMCSTPLSHGTPAWSGSGVLEGASGVVLALLAACTDDEPVWDRMFLVSTPVSSWAAS